MKLEVPMWIFPAILFYLNPVIASLPPHQEFEAGVRLVNFRKADEAKVRKALILIRRVIGSEEFKHRILEHTYQGRKTFVDNLGLSNEQIYQRIMEGAEVLNQVKNRRMDVELELYHQDTATIGYTYPNTSRIWMNTKYFHRYTPIQVADNLFHEWLHKLGFDHALRHSIGRNFSVPYAIGYLIEELASKYEKIPEQ